MQEKKKINSIYFHILFDNNDLSFNNTRNILKHSCVLQSVESSFNFVESIFNFDTLVAK